jgi:ribosomal protein L37E
MKKRFIIDNDGKIKDVTNRRCVKCDSYRIHKDECLYCGYKDNFFRDNIISNIEKYGFKKVMLFDIWKLSNIRIKPDKGSSSNMILRVKGNTDIIINRYGDFKHFKPYLDNLIGIDKLRNIVINNILS